jgi:hypothetical protein
MGFTTLNREAMPLPLRERGFLFDSVTRSARHCGITGFAASEDARDAGLAPCWSNGISARHR